MGLIMIPTDKVYQIEPFPYVRQTQGTKWTPRAKMYHANKGHLQALGFDYQEGWGITFHISMPKSWSNKKRAAMLFQPVRRKRWKDLDNLLKACLDSLTYDDGTISQFGPMRKVWSEVGRIIVHQRTVNYFNM